MFCLGICVIQIQNPVTIIRKQAQDPPRLFSDKEFFQFEEMRWGYRALIRTLQNYRRKHGLQTIAEMIGRWAPHTENNTGGYISRVCREMQVPSTCVPDVDDKGTMCALAASISEVENGVPAVMSEIEEGWELL